MTLATSLRATASKLMAKFGGTVDGYVRARDEQGRYLPDDPTTADVNEAWVKA